MIHSRRYVSRAFIQAVGHFAGVLILLATAAVAQQSSATASATVPIRKVNLPGGGRYFAVPIDVGSKHLFAGIDTGSPGLRVLAPALGPSDFESTGQEGRLQFVSGTILTGPRATAELSFGAVHGQATIQVVQKVLCGPKVPDCAEGNLPLDQLGLMGGGRAGQGAPAIFGASIASFPVENPLIELGVQRWILDIPNDRDGGRLVLNPPQESLGGFVRLPFLQEPGMPKDGLRGCIRNDRTQRTICGMILFDTGAAGMSVDSSEPLPPSWPDGTPASLLYNDAAGQPLLIQHFRTGDPSHSSRLHFHTDPSKKMAIIHANASPFFCFDVLYEADREALSLRPRRGGPRDPQAEVVTPAQ